jgi:hypothetical protein
MVDSGRFNKGTGSGWATTEKQKSRFCHIVKCGLGVLTVCKVNARSRPRDRHFWRQEFVTKKDLIR